MNSRVSQATYHDNMTSITHNFIVDAIQSLHFKPNMQCNPFKEQLEKSEDKTKVYIVMHIPRYNDRPTPYLLAVVPVANFPTGVDEIVTNPKFAMGVVCVKDYCDTGCNFKDINGLEVPDVVDTNDLKSVLEVITKKMWSVVEGEANMTPYSIVQILKTVDVEGLIIYCDPALHTCQECMLPIYKSMIKKMWEEICKGGSEYERKQKKHKSV